MLERKSRDLIVHRCRLLLKRLGGRRVLLEMRNSTASPRPSRRAPSPATSCPSRFVVDGPAIATRIKISMEVINHRVWFANRSKDARGTRRVSRRRVFKDGAASSAQMCTGVPRVMSDKIRRLPGALRHGGFSKIAILPGEDPDEFEQLHCGLIEEWRPNGPTEDDAVLTMAAAIWRKARLQKFRRALLYQEQFHPTCPTYDRALALHRFCSVIRAYPADFELALKSCQQSRRTSYEQNFRKNNSIP